MPESVVDKMQKTNPIKKYSWSLYAITLICLTMPFFTITCSSEKPDAYVDTYTGIELATGITADSDNKIEINSPNPFFTATLIAVVAGMLFAVAGPPKIRFILCLCASSLSVLAIMIFTIYVEIKQAGSSSRLLNYCYGYWAYLFLNLITFFAMLYFAMNEKNRTIHMNEPGNNDRT